ncbi:MULTISPECIES: 2-C-methyl-D-erythritol 2,4-cyclodiphosphate synthase [unclassified Polynucleobacter]|uniref:2-C-methyl-D-erythritol 2,4-cyclodiphosphate synthase n=1 Tax=unclassified Polynucleobacter TaxID=2640945 RepID=UPI00248FC94E|nr:MULTISPECIES: 2-C-methyl-D-erythritol 2,4-cyclodiphosphate synthase [unclassified Polynucleobacter]
MSNAPNSPRCHVLIPSAGNGSRFGGDIPKQFQMLAGKRVIDHSLDLFASMTEISSIWVGSSHPDLQLIPSLSKPIHITQTGGATRSQTVLNTLKWMIDQQIPLTDWVLVHDAARPGVRKKDVQNLISAVLEDVSACGGILALPVADTLKQSSMDHALIEKTVSRNLLWQAQTPQMFQLGQLKIAIEQAHTRGAEITDEASAMEALGFSPKLVKGSLENFKITYQEDLFTMEKLYRKESFMRIGQGYDVHRLVEGRALILGGVEVPYELGLLGHSDADALLHAITDALLGASGLGDIGKHFPDSDPLYKNANSIDLLKKTYQLVQEKGFELINLDATIICQSPKLSPHISSMIAKISESLVVDASRINIKAKTNEGLGYLGNSEAIETQAIVLLQTIN